MPQYFRLPPEAVEHFDEILKDFTPQYTFSQEIEAMNQRIISEANEAYENRQKTLTALQQTAQNTEETNNQLGVMVSQQMEYIGLLQEANKTLKRQLETQQNQLQVLQNIFASTEDAAIVEKEIMRLIAEQIDENHPLWEYVKDKGGDVLIAGGPVLFRAFKAFLIARGISF